MSKFNKRRKKRDVPGVNTSALPDIIFMLLFFFMVATTMKEVDMQVDIEKASCRSGSNNWKIKTTLISFISDSRIDAELGTHSDEFNWTIN